MSHEKTSPLLPDFVDGRLSSEEARSVEAHLAECEDCRADAEFHRRVRAEIVTHRESLFTDHPAAADLVAYALGAEGLPTPTMARVGAHVSACPTCSQEVSATRKADRSARSVWTRVGELFSAPSLGGPLPALASAAMVLLMVYPAYLGLVRLPQASRERDRVAAEVEALRSGQEDLDSSLRSLRQRLETISGWGGAVRSLYLPAPVRGEAEVVPVIRFRGGQPFQPVRIGFDPTLLGGPDLPLELALMRTENGRPKAVWSRSATVGELWDDADEAINILLPAAPLTPAEYRLELRVWGSDRVAYAARFRVEGPAAP